MPQILHWKRHNVPSDFTVIYSLLIPSSFQGWESWSIYKLLVEKPLIYTCNQCWLLLFKIFFGRLVCGWRKRRPHHQHEQQQNPITHFPSLPLASPQAPLQQLHGHRQPCWAEKEGLSSLVFPLSLFFFHNSTIPFLPQPLPAAKSPFPPQLARSFRELMMLMK